MALLQLGKYPEADQVADDLRAATGDDPEWMAKIGLAYSRFGRWERGAAVLERVIAKKPEFDAARVNYATALLNSSQVDRAIAVLTEGVRRNPRFPAFQLNLGHAFEKAGRVPEAIRAFKIYLQSYSNDAKIADKVRELETGKK
jgi:predicted Zn-dependent protease